MVYIGVIGTIILKWMFRNLDGEAWFRFDLAQDRDMWRALVMQL